MGRKKQNKTPFIVRMDADKRQQLEEQIIELGYYYTRDGVLLPSIGKYLEDVVDGNILHHKRVLNLSVDKET
ncbi:MAG: hypothetical protein ACKPE3_22595 [Sphaerospermopsis kisseleviana]